MYLFGVWAAGYWDWCRKLTQKRPWVWMLRVLAAQVVLFVLDAVIQHPAFTSLVSFAFVCIAGPIHFAAAKRLNER